MRVGRFASLWRALVTWRGGLFLEEGEIGVLFVSFLVFDTGGSVCRCMRAPPIESSD